MRLSVAILAALPLLFLAACEPAQEAPPRTVVVSGEGEVSVVPEVATVRMAIQARDPELEAARRQAATTVSAVLELAEKLDIDAERVSTTQLVVQPEYDWADGRQEFRGYLVQREIRVELEDLATLGPLLERAMQTGVNTVFPPELGVREPRELHRRALALAAEDAQANAAALAGMLDAKLGRVRGISAVDADAPVRLREREFLASADAAAEQSYQAGRITVRASVRAEFELR